MSLFWLRYLHTFAMVKVDIKKDRGMEKYLTLMDLSKIKIGITYIARANVDINIECFKLIGIKPTPTIIRIKMPA